MRISFDSQIFFDQRYGGVSRYFTRLAECLHEEGEDVGIFAPVYLNAYISELRPGIVRGTRVPTCFGRLHRWINKPNIRLAQSRISKWKPDIVHETYYSGGRKSAPGAKTAVTVYDMIHELFPEAFHADDRTAERKRDAVRKADHIICISESTRRDLTEILDVPYEKTSVTHLGFEPVRNRFLEAPAPERMPTVLYVGQRGGYKNFTSLLKAYSSSPDLRAETELVAFGGGAFTVEELALIAELGLKGNVRQTGGDDAALRAAYQQARVFVNPSRYEGFGLPPLEAIAHGCVVASSNTSSMPEVLGDSAVYFDPESIGEMAKATEKAAFDESCRAELLENGERRLSLFSWEKCARETLHIYRSLID